jgi:hypothetical protein
MKSYLAGFAGVTCVALAGAALAQMVQPMPPGYSPQPQPYMQPLPPEGQQPGYPANQFNTGPVEPMTQPSYISGTPSWMQDDGSSSDHPVHMPGDHSGDQLNMLYQNGISVPPGMGLPAGPGPLESNTLGHPAQLAAGAAGGTEVPPHLN